ncbi:Autophagy-related protein 17 [Penicillium chermesinum]|nr:Autophagy-related protein 17 [Penicillium chermesinum]
MQSSHSSAGATSQPQSPRPSDSEPMPSLEVLISHLLAAKRSLSSINHVWQANEIVTAAGKKVLECAALKSRIAFARRTLQDQLELLRKTRAWSEEIVRAGREAFSDALNNLDAADDRLSQALDALRDTTVHSAFRPDDEDPKTLHDFVDEMGLEGLHTSLKSSIDRVTAIQAELDASNGVFDADIGSIHHKLRHWMSSIQQTSSSPELETSSDEDPEPELAVAKPVVAMFRSLESHAKDMAELLSSLVHHFDRCVKAVKHTEGGGEAARSITGDMPEVPAGEGMSNIGQEINANLNAPLQPMSNEEYREMVLVLIKDAFEAEDVVVEIQDRITEMEQIAQNMDLQHDMLKSLWKHAGQIKADMIGVNDRLPQYGLQSLKFIATWREEISNLNSGLAQLTDLHVMYEEFSILMTT